MKTTKILNSIQPNEVETYNDETYVGVPADVNIIAPNAFKGLKVDKLFIPASVSLLMMSAFDGVEVKTLFFQNSIQIVASKDLFVDPLDLSAYQSNRTSLQIDRLGEKSSPSCKIAEVVVPTDQDVFIASCAFGEGTKVYTQQQYEARCSKQEQTEKTADKSTTK